eukprot:9425580-Pyramimonas_sp.AAC.1
MAAPARFTFGAPMFESAVGDSGSGDGSGSDSRMAVYVRYGNTSALPASDWSVMGIHPRFLAASDWSVMGIHPRFLHLIVVRYGNTSTLPASDWSVMGIYRYTSLPRTEACLQSNMNTQQLTHVHDVLTTAAPLLHTAPTEAERYSPHHPCDW